MSTVKSPTTLSNDVVKSLYKGGLKVHVEHFRRRKDFSPRRTFNVAGIRHEKKQDVIEPKGGKTVVHLIDLKQGLQWKGEAYCHPDDHYNRKEGIMRAFNSAKWFRSNDIIELDTGSHIYAAPIDFSLLSFEEALTVSSNSKQ